MIRVAAYQPVSYVVVDGREIEVDILSIRLIGGVLLALVYAQEGQPFVTESGLPTNCADFELDLVKVRRQQIYLHSLGYTQNDTDRIPA